MADGLTCPLPSRFTERSPPLFKGLSQLFFRIHAHGYTKEWRGTAMAPGAKKILIGLGKKEQQANKTNVGGDDRLFLRCLLPAHPSSVTHNFPRNVTP